jgi:hypothetical protein
MRVESIELHFRNSFDVFRDGGKHSRSRKVLVFELHYYL